MQITQVSGGPAQLPLEHELKHEPVPMAMHALEEHDVLSELRTVEDWWAEATESLAECFAEMALDHDYYDHLQWSETEKAELIARGQAPLVFNKCALTVDWLTGTERRTRIDFAVVPKRREASDAAEVKAKLIKYQSDTNMVPWNRSRAFKDACIGGVGWTEASIRGDDSQELVLHGYVPWQQVKWDPFSRSLDLDDSRYLHRRKWVDLDYAIQMFPEREAVLRLAARSHIFGDDEWSQDQLDLPQVFRRYDSRGAELVERRWSGALPITGSTHRLRVPLTETWFRQPKRIKRIWGLDHHGDTFDAGNEEMAQAVAQKAASLTDAVTEEMRIAIWVPGAMVYRGPLPFRHRSFPLTPVWAKRRSRDGTPYGVIRGIRDAQDDYNKRLSKAQWLLATNQFHYEEGAIDPDRKTEIQRNLAKPGGMIEYAQGALSMGKTRIDRNVELAEAQTMLLEVSAAHIHDGSGVNREMLGRETNAISGRAIHAKQNEGSVATAELFDNLRLHVQLDGKKLLSLNEQFMTLPMQVRVAGEDARKQFDWLDINQPELGEDNTWSLKNDITKADADFVVDQIDFRESVRAAQAEQFGEMLKNMPEQVQLALLDIFIEMTDIPMRDEAVRRVRTVTGQGAADEEDPLAELQRQQKEQAEQQEQQLLQRERMAKVSLDEAKREETMAKARKIGVEGKGTALQIAELIQALLPLAPAADRLYQPEEVNAEPQ